MFILFIMISNVSVKVRNPIIASIMMGVGQFAGFTIMPSEIVKRGEEVKIPYLYLAASFFAIPPVHIIWVRYMRYIRLRSILQNNLTKQEYQAILENSNQTFICHNDSHEARYFNSQGHQMLRQIADLTENKEANLEDLDSKKRVFDIHGQV